MSLSPNQGAIEPTSGLMNPQMFSTSTYPQLSTSTDIQGGPMQVSMQDSNIQSPPPGDLSDKPRSNMSLGLIERAQRNYTLQQNISQNKGEGILSHEALVEYLADFKRQITEIIKIDPDDDKDLSDAQGKKIIEALSSQEAKIEGLQHTLYRQNRKLMNDISSEKRKLENKLASKFAELEEKLEKQLKAKGDKSKHSEKKTNSESSPSKSPSRSSDKSPKKSPNKSNKSNKSHKTEKSPKKSNSSVKLPTQLSSDISQQKPMTQSYTSQKMPNIIN